jgi:serine protease Do
LVIAGVAVLLLIGGLGVTRAAGTGSPAQAPAAAAVLPAGAPTSFADLSEKLSKSVVNIKVTKVERTASPEVFGPKGPGSGTPFDEFFGQFFGGLPQMPREHRQQGAGSGFILSAEGLILTNNHVVEGAKEITVTLADKQEYPAKVVGRDPKTDIALLKIDAKAGLPAVALGDSEQLRVGDWVVAIGNPFGLSNTVTAGIVSAKGRVIGASPYDDFIQTDASINPGNSGGPLFNLRGEVVGINTAIVPNGQGIGFAVPINQAKALVPQLEANGTVTRGYLGVSIQDVTPALAKSLQLPDARGALVADVTKGSPAASAGIRRGDVILRFEDTAVADAHALPTLVAATPVGKTVALTVRRNGREETIRATVGQMPGERTAANDLAAPAQGSWGLALRELDARTAGRLGLQAGDGVLVTAVRPESPAAEAGVRPGDVIREVNRHPVTSAAEVQAAAKQSAAGEPLLLLLKRGDATLFAALTGEDPTRK